MIFKYFGIFFAIVAITAFIIFVVAYIHIFISAIHKRTNKKYDDEKTIIDESQESLKSTSNNASNKNKTITCEYCGSKIDKDAKSCSNCGKKL